jgi:hypothetical protein
MGHCATAGVPSYHEVSVWNRPWAWIVVPSSVRSLVTLNKIQSPLRTCQQIFLILELDDLPVSLDKWSRELSVDGKPISGNAIRSNCLISDMQIIGPRDTGIRHGRASRVGGFAGTCATESGVGTDTSAKVIGGCASSVSGTIRVDRLIWV